MGRSPEPLGNWRNVAPSPSAAGLVCGGTDAWRFAMPAVPAVRGIYHGMGNIVVTPKQFTPGEAEKVSGIAPDQVRDWKRRGFPVASEGHRTPLDLASLLLVRKLIGVRLGPSVSWLFAQEVAGAVLLAAGQEPGTIEDRTGKGVFKGNASLRIKAAFELVGPGTRHVAGPIFAWADGVAPSAYASLEHAQSDIESTTGEPAVITFFDLRGLGKLLAKRAGVLGYLDAAP